MIIVEFANGGKDIGLFLLPLLGEGGDGGGPHHGEIVFVDKALII